MSRGARLVLPTQKGTELFPRTTQPPTKLVIRGVPADTPLYHAVANAYAGRLKSFHAKAQQSYSLSNNEVNKQRFDWGDGARATYINLQGQETIELEVSAAIKQEVSEQITSKEDYWEWALIEVAIPDIGAADILYGEIKAFRRIPAPAEATQKFDGFAYDQGAVFEHTTYWSDGMDPFVMSFPSRTVTPIEAVLESDGATQIASLQVDLRPIPKAQVVIDLYGILDPTGTTEDEVIGYGIRGGTTTDTPVNSDFPIGDWAYASGGRLFGYVIPGYTLPQEPGTSAPTPTNAYIPGYPYTPNPPNDLTNVAIPAPNMVIAESGAGMSFYEFEPVYHSLSNLLLVQTFSWVQMVAVVGGVEYVNEFFRKVKYNIVPLTTQVFAPTTGARNAEVRGVGGFGHPDWAESQHIAPDAQWWQWEVKSAYPKRLQTALMGHAQINTEEYRLLGSVTIDPVLKSISFAPA